VPALIQPPLPSPAGNGSFSLDEYFDLLDEVLACVQPGPPPPLRGSGEPG